MKMRFTIRNEEGLHCRFCHAEYPMEDLYETSPVKGIVCINCKKHLESYIKH